MYKNIVLIDNDYFDDLEGIKRTLINEVERDTISNREDKSIVENNLEMLEDIFTRDNTIDYYINELKLFGYYIVKLEDIMNNLKDLEEYFKKNRYNDDLELEIRNTIRDLKDKINEYWNNNMGL